MRFSARAVKTLPRTWFMSVIVLSLPEREANSAASFSDSRRCSSSRAWWMQKEGWPFLRSMRQVRPSEVWRRHLLLLGSRESEFIWNLKRKWIASETQRAPIQEGRKILLGDAATSALATGRRILQAKCYRNRYVPVNIILRATENTDFNVDAVAKIPNLGLRRAARNTEEKRERSFSFRIALETPL